MSSSRKAQKEFSIPRGVKLEEIPKDIYRKNKMYIHIGTGTITNKFWFVEYILSIINGDMGVPFQVRSRYFSRLAVLKLSWGNLFIHFL